MEFSYDVLTRLSLESAGFTTATGLAMRLMGDMEGKATAAERAVAKLAQRFNLPVDQFTSQATSMGKYTTEINAASAAHANLAKAQGGLGSVILGASLVGVGLAGVSAMKGAVTAAGMMQDALAQVGIAAQGTQAQLGALFTQSFSVANATQFSASSVLAMDQIMARMNFNDPTHKQSQRQVIQDAIPQFARAAEIAQHFQHTGYEETITGLAQQAHMMGAYSGAALARNVGYSTQLGIVSHMTAQQQANALSYLTPSMKTGQLGTLDAMALVALSNQTGLNQGKGASNLGALMRGLAPTGAPKHDRALADIERLGGGKFYDAKGDAVPLTTALGILNKFYDNKTITNERRGVIAQHGLGVQGMRAAAVLGSDLSINQFGGLRTRIAAGTPAASEAEQRQLNATLPGSLATLSGNIGSLSALLGAQLLPVVTPLVHGLVAATGALVDLLSHHQKVAAFAATFLAIGSAASIAVGGILAARGAMEILRVTSIATDLSMGPLLGTVGALALAVGAASLVITNWGTITGALTGKLGPLWQAVSIGGLAIGGFVVGIKGAELAIASWGAITSAASAATALWATATGSAAVSGSVLTGVLPAMISGIGGMTAAATGLDFVLSPFILGLGTVALAVGAAVLVFRDWKDISTALGQDMAWLNMKTRDFTSAIDALAKRKDAIGGVFQGLQAPTNPGNALGGYVHSLFGGASPTPKPGTTPPGGRQPATPPTGPAVDIAHPFNPGDALGHWLRQFAGVPGSKGGTGYGQGGGGFEAVPSALSATLAHTATRAAMVPPAPAHTALTAALALPHVTARPGVAPAVSRPTAQTPTRTPVAQRPSAIPAARAPGAAPTQVHNHYAITVAKDAINTTITTHPGQSPAQIGDHVSQATIKAITKELADALSRGGHRYKGLIPSSNAQW